MQLFRLVLEKRIPDQRLAVPVEEQLRRIRYSYESLGYVVRELECEEPREGKED